jgi:hypothetical protein
MTRRREPLYYSGVRLRIGIDFDNTIVAYDALFVACAIEAGLVDAGFRGGKTALRDALRALPDGNWKWTQLQARVYGSEIERATPFDGFGAFLDRARERGAHLAIVSQKSRFAAADPDGVDLRVAAYDWLRRRGLLEPAGPFRGATVFFESERRDKLARIAQLACTHFVDDLAEIFADSAFPPGVRRLHFVPCAEAGAAGYRSWAAISDAIFADA